MTENYALRKEKELKPKKATIQMILNYSTSYKVVKNKGFCFGMNVN